MNLGDWVRVYGTTKIGYIVKLNKIDRTVKIKVLDGGVSPWIGFEDIIAIRERLAVEDYEAMLELALSVKDFDWCREIEEMIRVLRREV